MNSTAALQLYLLGVGVTAVIALHEIRTRPEKDLRAEQEATREAFSPTAAPRQVKEARQAAEDAHDNYVTSKQLRSLTDHPATQTFVLVSAGLAWPILLTRFLWRGAENAWMQAPPANIACDWCETLSPPALTSRRARRKAARLGWRTDQEGNRDSCPECSQAHPET